MAEGDTDVVGPWTGGPAGFGGGGGVSLPPEFDGTAVSSNAGSPLIRDLGGGSTVELRVAPEPGRAGTFTGEDGESEFTGSASEGTELIEPVLGPSDVTVVPDPQFVHGVEAGAGVAKIGRYDWRPRLQPTAVTAAIIDTATGNARRVRTPIAASFCRAIIILLTRFEGCPTSPVGSQSPTSRKRDAEL
jgi:hypothetical protein